MKARRIIIFLAATLLSSCSKEVGNASSSSLSTSLIETSEVSQEQSSEESSIEASSETSLETSSEVSSGESSSIPTTSLDPSSYYRLSPTDFGTTVYSLDYETATFVDSGYTISIDQDCLTAEEVCYYWVAFRTYPPNYFTTSSYGADKTSALAYGVNGRCASRYRYVDRPDGYALVLGPYYNQIETSYYWELDIDLTGSYNNGYSITRGRGRVVVVADGLEAYGGDGPVCYLTQDHYGSFYEFYNYKGGWGTAFSSSATRPKPETLYL